MEEAADEAGSPGGRRECAELLAKLPAEPSAPLEAAGSPVSPGKRCRSPAPAAAAKALSPGPRRRLVAESPPELSPAAAKWLKTCKGKQDYERKKAKRLARKA